MQQVLLAAPISETFRRFLQERGFGLLQQEAADAQSKLHVAGIVTSNKLLLDEEALHNYPNLQWIARLGSGMEIIDTVCCDRRGIRYWSSPAGIANSVGEHTLGMLLALRHHIYRSFHEIEQGLWIREANRGHEIENLCVGLIGYGHTGRAVASKLRAFTPHVLAYDKYQQGFGNEVVQEVSLEYIQEQADVLSFHVPLNEETHSYYNHEFLGAMRKPHILVNVSRGAVCQTDVILEGLASGKITGACLDVLAEEQEIQSALLAPDHPVRRLLQYPVIMTPHIAGYSYEAIEKMSAELMNHLNDYL